MRRARSGSIVAFSSIMGVAYGPKGSVRHSAAKAGIVGLVRGLAVELARDGIRVNGIAPGYTKTAQSPSEEYSSGPEGLARVTEYIPLGRVGNPEDIADVTVFLASDAARYLTGQVLVVEGGLLVGRYRVARPNRALGHRCGSYARRHRLHGITSPKLGPNVWPV